MTPLIYRILRRALPSCWGALASWEDANRTRWVLTPFWGPKHPQFKWPIEHGTITYGAVAAFKMAEPPIIANGLVAQGTSRSARLRAGPTAPASAGWRAVRSAKKAGSPPTWQEPLIQANSP
jgi:hypothetical protein